MKIVAPHLNLLRPEERLSSSPVRLRIMGPVLAALACAGLLVWWGVLGMQTMMAKNAVAALVSEQALRIAVGQDVSEQVAEVVFEWPAEGDLSAPPKVPKGGKAK